MPSVYLADTISAERSAFRLIIRDLGWNLAGEAADWPTVLAQVPLSRSDILVVSWILLSTSPGEGIKRLRMSCQVPLVVVLVSPMDSRQQAALSTGADVFISRNEMAERVVDRFRAIATQFY